MSERERKGYPSPLVRALRYVEEHISCPELKSAAVAVYADVSEVYLRRLFVENLDTSLMEYVRKRRLDLACMLLKDTSSSVTDISFRCGYSSIYHFCRAFKGTVGCTPTEYRDNNASLAF
jgi:AraC-like DNA-binding protein